MLVRANTSTGSQKAPAEQEPQAGEDGGAGGGISPGSRIPAGDPGAACELLDPRTETPRWPASSPGTPGEALPNGLLLRGKGGGALHRGTLPVREEPQARPMSASEPAVRTRSVSRSSSGKEPTYPTRSRVSGPGDPKRGAASPRR